MFESPPRRHPVQTFQFWFLVLMSAGVAAAWKFDLLSLGTRPSSLPVMTDEPMPPPPGGAAALPIQQEASGRETAEIAATGNPLLATGERIAPAPPGQLESDSQTETPRDFADRAAWTDVEADANAAPVQMVRAESVTPGAPVSALPVQSEEPPSAEQSKPAVRSRPFDLEEADALIDAGKDVDAHRLLSSWYWEHPQFRSDLIGRLNLLARRIYFQPQPHYLPPHKLQFGERIETVAQRNRVSPEYLSRLNRLDSQNVPNGQSLKVLPGPFGAVVDRSAGEVTVHAHGYYVMSFPLIGASSAVTPTGTFQVTQKVPGQHALNETQRFRLVLNDKQKSLPEFGFAGVAAGSNAPHSTRAECLHMQDRDLADLADLLVIGSEVTVR